MIRQHKVYCEGCAYLFICGGSIAPMCVATCEFVSGPLRRKVAVTDFGVFAGERNIHNDCPYRQRVSLKAWELKRWILWRINNGKTKAVGEGSLKDYPVEKEFSFKTGTLKSFRSDSQIENKANSPGEEREDSEVESETEAAEVEEASEDFDVFDDGGSGDNDQSGASREGGGKELQDP